MADDSEEFLARVNLTFDEIDAGNPSKHGPPPTGAISYIKFIKCVQT
jgi:hypothetical protein